MSRSCYNAIKFSLALIAIVAMWKVAYRNGYEDSGRSIGYWDGWNDAMNVTKYGTVPYNGMK